MPVPLLEARSNVLPGHPRTLQADRKFFSRIANSGHGLFDLHYTAGKYRSGDRQTTPHFGMAVILRQDKIPKFLS